MEEGPRPRERLNRYLARCGMGSRRKCDELIQAGRVQVNGHVVTRLGTTVDPACDRVAVDGHPVRPQEHVYILLHKPPGYVSTARDPQGRPTVLDLVPGDVRLYPVGRLDWDTSGLLLLTNDGPLAFRLTHPRFEVPRTYRALVRGVPGPRALSRLRRGVMVGGRPTAPARVRILGRDGENAWLEVTVREGRYHQVKLMAEAVGHPVLRLTRVRMGPLSLGRLPPGQFRYLTGKELAALRRAVGIPAPGEQRPAKSEGKWAR
ncbi:MAG: pseudouridine synthase [Bacillota bacterium]